MKKLFTFLLALAFALPLFSQDFSDPLVDEDLVFEEINGEVAVEAEYFYKQSMTDIRKWYRTSQDETPAVDPDVDAPHVAGASMGAYLEILPDTRIIHEANLIPGENFSNEPGKLAIVHYKVYFNTPGKYYAWVRTHSTGSEDDGLHVGLDGEWPESGQRLQWCEGLNTWHWESKQRTDKVYCGVPYLIFLEIKKTGIHEIMFSMREDGFEFDKFVLTLQKDPGFGVGTGPEMRIKSGTLPPSFPLVDVEAVAPAKPLPYLGKMAKAVYGSQIIKAVDFTIDGTNFYKNNSWLAINPELHKKAEVSMPFPFEGGAYDLVLAAVGENDGSSTYKIWFNEKEIGTYKVPMSESTYDEGPKYNRVWEGVEINKGDLIKVQAEIGSADGQEFSRGRWNGLVFTPVARGNEAAAVKKNQQVNATAKLLPEPKLPFTDPSQRKPDGDGSVEISGELKQWHKVSLTLDGPFAHELDKQPNPFSEYNMMVRFVHASGSPDYQVPGYFAADGNAGESSADAGCKWRAHLSPDKEGEWSYKISFRKGPDAAQENSGELLENYSGIKGNFTIARSDKNGRDFRADGRLEYVGLHYLQFQGSKRYFVKAGADAPETLLAYEDFDATYALKPNVPLKKYESHLSDWKEGYPTWKDEKGKGLIGAIAYLSKKGANSISFLPYNAGGDGDNVWPFIKRNEKKHYDCSKLDQWGIVFDFAQEKGIYLHFKLQENENDDNVLGKKDTKVPESLDGGDLGPERKLYCREMIARYGHLLALNWNIGEENTQSTAQVVDMVSYIDEMQPYRHNIVIHTFPNQQDKVYLPLLGSASLITGVSLQNGWDKVFELTLKWRKASFEAGRPWVVANDEQNSHETGVPPDPGYKGFDAGSIDYDLHDVRKQTLYGNLMAGGAGVEYYFGYKLPECDLTMEDFRSRDKSWEYAGIALNFFHTYIPFHEMENADQLVDNVNLGREKHCLAKKGEVYLVYLAYAKTTSLDLRQVKGKFKVQWFNPRTGGELQSAAVSKVKGGKLVELGAPPVEDGKDWLVLIRR